MDPISPTQLNNLINAQLAEQIFTVQGEVSDFKIAKEKFVYFDLKDEGSKVPCFMMRYQLPAKLTEGMKIKIIGTPGLYVPYGRYTFRVQALEMIGVGALQKAFEELKQKLTAEGLFTDEHKRPLPRFPEKVAVVTSDGAAALTDTLRILENRWSGLEIIHVPTSVQGLAAVEEIVTALRFINETTSVDTIILTRGGGSLEDLQSFNAEPVVRAVFASKHPIVVGVGHERDTTLAELAADVRASTPSNAAERVVPDKNAILSQLNQIKTQLGNSMQFQVSNFQSSLDQIRQNLLHLWSNRLNEFDTLKRAIISYNPEQTLKRGYSIVRDSKGKIVKSDKQVKPGAKMKVQYARGEDYVQKVEKLI